MKLYKITDAPPGERFHSSKTGLKDFEEIELPKEGRAAMAVFFNNNERELLEPVGRHNWTKPLGGDPTVVAGGRPLDELEQAEERAVSLAQHTKWGRGEIEDDGHPAVRSAYTPAQVACASLPSSPVVQDVCHIIAKMGPAELGFVALEVVARGAVLGGVSRNYNAGASKGIDDGR